MINGKHVALYGSQHINIYFYDRKLYFFHLFLNTVKSGKILKILPVHLFILKHCKCFNLDFDMMRYFNISYNIKVSAPCY